MSALSSLVHSYGSLLDWILPIGSLAFVLLLVVRHLRRRRSDPMADADSDSDPTGLEVLISLRATSFIREHGGNLYVWGDAVGDGSYVFVKWGTNPPGHAVAFHPRAAQSVTVNIEPGLWFGDWLEVKMAPLPFARLRLTWDGQFYGSASGG